MRSTFRQSLFVILALILAACGSGSEPASEVEAPEAEIAIVEEIPPSTPASEAQDDNSESGPFTIVVSMSELPEGAEFDTVGLPEIVESSLISRYPGNALTSVEFQAGALHFTFSGEWQQSFCEDLFLMFGENPNCLSAQSAETAETAEDIQAVDEVPEADAAQIQAAVDGILPSVIAIQSDGGGGSGFFIRSDGYILTNQHVLIGHSDFRVTLIDGRQFSATLVGYVEEGTPDVGVLKIGGADFSAANIGSSSALQFGDPIMVLGHPAGYGDWLATSGYYDRMQSENVVTTAPSSEGSSGAPMVNQFGEVVGLLWGEEAGSSALGAFVPTPPEDWEIMWNFNEFQSLRTHSSWGVPIETAIQLAELIIERGGNVSSSEQFSAPEYDLDGTILQLEAPGEVEISAINEFFLADYADTELLNGTLNNGIYSLEFNREPSQAAVDAVLAFFAQMLASDPNLSIANTEYSVTNAGAIAGPFAEHADGDAARTAAEIVLPSVVFLRGPGANNEFSNGSGFFISGDGYILTNAHVLDEVLPGATLEVFLYDGRVFEGQVIGYDLDQDPDVGVVRIQADNTPVATIADSGSISVGESVVQIGHPGFYGYWVASGGEILRLRDSDEQFDQSNAGAAGSSGGPLANLKGEVIGLVWGRPGGETPDNPSRENDTIIWTWEEYWALQEQYTSAVMINEAIDVANQIIAANGNLP
jgi:S1-C subfamily serine protease